MESVLDDSVIKNMIDFSTTYLTMLIMAMAVWTIIVISGYKKTDKQFYISMAVFFALVLGEIVMRATDYELPTVEVINSKMLGLKTLLSITLGVLPYAVILGGLIIRRNKKSDKENVV